MGKIGIITAMDEEAAHIIDLLKLKLVEKLQHISFYENNNYILALAGIGKIQAAIGTTILIEKYGVEKIINIGIAGNLRGNEVKIGDVFLINTIIQHDMYLPFEGSHLDYIKKEINISTKCDIDPSNLDFGYYEKGVCVTGDEFVDKENRSLELKNKYAADVAEMECFAVATVAREFGLLENTYIIKAVSDGADSDALKAHANNLDFAMKNSLTVLKKVLEIS